ncbi:neuropilin and tolloid-like protein 2 [Ptychodera flava]|uniref:neuropilin and tolloid-like protein 2 n=1 Tax=Ptychodera flava TaxID=63121 RepID=UPI00396A0683
MATFWRNFWIFICLAATYHVGKATVYMEDNCGKTITLAGDRLKSQKGSTYKSNQDCTITLQAPSSGSSYSTKLVLDFESMQMESATSSSCYDFLEVYDGSGTYSTLVLRACGSATPYNIISTQESLTLRMKTDGTYRYSGFSLIFTAYHNGPCVDDDEFHCSTGRCIDTSIECDCKDNCGDNTDELSCSTCKADVVYGEGGMSTGAIIGIVVAVLIAIIIVIIIVCVVCNKKQKPNRAVASSHDMTSRSIRQAQPPPPMMHYPPPAPGPPPYAPPPYSPPSYNASVMPAPGYYGQPPPPPNPQQPPYPPQQQPPYQPTSDTLYTNDGNPQENLATQPSVPHPTHPTPSAPPTGSIGQQPPAYAPGAANHGFQDDPAYPPRIS